MAKVKMRAQISGTRDGADWPAPGSVIDLPDDEAAALVANGSAVELGDDEPVEENADASEGGVETATPKKAPAKKAVSSS